MKTFRFRFRLIVLTIRFLHCLWFYSSFAVCYLPHWWARVITHNNIGTSAHFKQLGTHKSIHSLIFVANVAMSLIRIKTIPEPKTSRFRLQFSFGFGTCIPFTIHQSFTERHSVSVLCGLTLCERVCAVFTIHNSYL